eukprot:scaffold25422_cov80-Phaeocystis_antarctica.AAC.4
MYSSEDEVDNGKNAAERSKLASEQCTSADTKRKPVSPRAHRETSDYSRLSQGLNFGGASCGAAPTPTRCRCRRPPSSVPPSSALTSGSSTAICARSSWFCGLSTATFAWSCWFCCCSSAIKRRHPAALHAASCAARSAATPDQPQPA